MHSWSPLLSRDFSEELQGRSVIIAGGASGMGAALVDAYHWLGAKVVILDKNAQQASALADRLEERGKDTIRPVVVAADLIDEKERSGAVSEAISQAGLPGTFISTLGFDRRIGLENHGQDDLELLLRINFIAPVMLARDFIPQMRRAGGGAICLFSSHHGSDLIDTDMMGYGAAKAALDNGIRRLARYAAEKNTPENSVRVFGLRPGWVQTPNQTSRFQESDFERTRLEQLIPVSMKAEDIVPFVVSVMSLRQGFLLSGTILDYDAGSGQISRPMETGK